MPDRERTFVMIKPDAHARRLSGEILSRFERRGFTIRGMKLLRVTGDQAASHYAEHEGKPFYPELVEFITSGPVVAMVLEGPAGLDRADDDGRDGPAGLGTGNDPGRLRARDRRERGARVGLGGLGGARDRDLLHRGRAGLIRLLSPLTLASRSPQRRAILAQLGIEFTVVEPEYEEIDPPGSAPQELVVAHATGKARSVPGDLVLGVDTTVSVDGISLAKPDGPQHAAAMLRQLSGRTHTVYSGLCLRADGTEHVRLAATDVTFRPLDEADIGWYLEQGE